MYIKLAIIVLLSIICIKNISFAQVKKGMIKGRITSQNNPVPFANINLKGARLGGASDHNGSYSITHIPYGTYQLQASAIGYTLLEKSIVINDTTPQIINLRLAASSTKLEEIVVTGTLKEVSKLESPVPVEVFTHHYFKKTPTPVLFEAMEMVNGVRPQLNCSVCNTGDIHINGMEGPYTMVLIDGMPIVSGLSTVYGLNGIPMSMVDRIEVIKGPASTLYGSEAVGGIINVITKRVDHTPVLSMDIWGTTWQEYNADIGVKATLGKLSTVIGVNYFNYANPVDNNNDSFTDVALASRFSIFNKWNLQRPYNRRMTLALRYVYEDRWGGQMQWTPKYRGGDQIYGESIYTNRLEIIGTYQLPIAKEDLFFNYSFNIHQQDTYYGDMPFMADQKIAFGQLLWDKELGPRHNFLLGVATRYTYYDDNTTATSTKEQESGLSVNTPSKIYLPGVFLQDELTLGEAHKLLLGIRYDYDSYHGSIFSPRLNYKWSPNDRNIFRLSLGNGFRVVNLFTEEHAALTGAREVVIQEALKPEKSLNANINYQRFFVFKSGVITLDASAFYTYFTNKITPDYEKNDDQIIYTNLNGYAVSRGLALNTDFTFTFPLNVNAGITFLDVFEVEHANGKKIKTQPLLTEKVSAIWTVSYTFSRWQMRIDYTGNVYGPMKLPLQENDYRPAYSDTYSLQNIQITKIFRFGLEVYGGIKNIFNFTPAGDIIMRPFDPFDKAANDPISNPHNYNFDTSYIYAPNQGIRSFLGIRYQFTKQNK